MPIENYMCREIPVAKPRGLYVCACCEEVIRQERALHVFAGKQREWICDRCVEDMMEYTEYEEDERNECII